MTTGSTEHPGEGGWVRRLTGYVMRHRRDVSIAFAAAVLGSACQAAVPLVERQIVDAVILRHSAPLWPWLLGLVALAAATFGFAYLRRYRGGRVALSVQYDLRNDMQAHLQGMDFAHLDRLPTGQLVARANSDATVVQGLLSFLPIMSGNVLLLVASLVVMLYLSPLLALVSLVMAPALLVVSYQLRRSVFPASWDAQQREGDLVQIVDEDVNGVRVVKAFGQERRELERVADAAAVLYGSQMRAVRLQARYQPLLQAIPSLGQVAVLALGGWLALHHGLTLGTFLAFSTYVAQLMSPARQLAGLLSVGQQARASVERIMALLDLRPSIVDAPAAVALPRLDGRITFRDVSFAYTDPDTDADADADPGAEADDPPASVLHGFDLDIAPGERVALVGPSGSGKSTVTTLVSRFYDPDQGAVLVDGHDVKTVTLSSLRRQVGVVFEESFLFSLSIRANIAYARPDASDDEVQAAARVAEADGFITDLPQGYDTVVGERGLTLSGGQRQRIALARAVLSDPRILILDDATSAVDAVTEEAINRTLRQVMRGRTTLLVAHRRSTLHLADRVVVMDGGRVVAQGTHDGLLETNALYRSLLTGLSDEDVRLLDQPVDQPADHRSGGISAAAWGTAGSGPARRFKARANGAASIGGGLGRSGGGGWRNGLAPTPDLIERVDGLRPVRDSAAVDLDVEATPDPGFSLPRLLRGFRRPLLLGLVFVVIDALAALAGPVLVKTGIDNGVSAGSSAVLFAAAGAYLVITLVDLFDEAAETFVTGRTAQRVMLSLRIRIWAQLQRLSLDYYERELAGRTMTRMTTDVDQFESLIQNGLLSALVSFVTFLGVGVALLVVNLELGLYTLAIVIPLAVATVVFRRRAARLYDDARDRVAIANADFQESLSGVRESQAFGQEAAAISRFRGLGADYLASRVAAQRLVATYFPFVQFLSAGADAIVLGVGAVLIGNGSLTSGALIAFILYVDLFFSPIQALSQVFDSWQQTRVSVGRISELMRMDTLTPAAAQPVDPGRVRGQVTFADVHFRYPSAPPRSDRGADARRGPADPRLLPGSSVLARPPEALRGVDLDVAAGETVALVGETGAGKSTVVKLIARFYDPDSGSVRIDGRDLRRLDLAAFRSRLGYVPQEAFLFTGSVRDNIAYGRHDATDAEVEAAARAVGAHDLIAGMAGGYHQEISERGRSLSSGQRQLIALARAELVDPAILLLDEATSNLDLATETRVADAMQRLSRGRTTIVIAHRLQTARAADRIVVLDRGRVIEAGGHDDLVARGGRYAQMWAAFERHGEDDALDVTPVAS